MALISEGKKHFDTFASPECVSIHFICYYYFLLFLILFLFYFIYFIFLLTGCSQIKDYYDITFFGKSQITDTQII